ncbi:uncharacterized protein J4E79_003101 [Alternaria viburni]|uniref:uncharacterized protein n=1 Tax=Alternaria viburni TaxID=566460 RepID=UPI0020C49017|nr:uncharacterized protein J4E79_003101 [Alternaria viburni]KAI4664803.1 hypothetical protein J4E79_003101 [Alternaria viburni]
MQHFNTVLALAAAVSAVDIKSHGESHCKGVTHTYVNANPNKCYGLGGTSWAWSFNAIPTNWNLETRTHKDGYCKTLVHAWNSNGASTVCHGAAVNNLKYTGAGYSFANKKRSEDTVFNSEDCIWKPDLLTLKDGTTYMLTDVEDETVKIILAYGDNTTIAENMPNLFDKYITQERR